MTKITLADWQATPKQKKLVKEVLNSGRLTYGDKTRELEKRFAEIHGAKHALFTSSGTAALKISLHALKDKHGWKNGSEVIIPSVTFVATMNAVLMNNLKPVLVDVSLDTANINPDLIEKSITHRTVAIMPVHLLGQVADMGKIMNIANKYNLRVVTDSCETMFVNKHVGDMTCFSTYVAHLMVTGVGGFILTNNDKLATVMRSMMFHGRDESYLSIDDKPVNIHKRFWFPRQGYSDRMTEMEAALGLGELDGWQEMVSKRRQNAYYLMDNLPEHLHFPIGEHNHSFMFFPVYVDNRDKLMVYLEKNNIQSRQMMPLTTQPTAKLFLGNKHRKKTFPSADYINRKGLLIPCHQYLLKKDLQYIVSTIERFYQ